MPASAHSHAPQYTFLPTNSTQVLARLTTKRYNKPRVNTYSFSTPTHCLRRIPSATYWRWRVNMKTSAASEYACFTLTGVLHRNRAAAFLLPGRLSAKCQVCRPFSHTAAHSGVTTCSILTRSKPHPSTSCRAHSCLPQRKHYPSVGLLTRSSSCMAKTLIFPTACC